MKFRSIALVIFAFVLTAPYASAQGFVQVFGIPKTAVATGQTEVLGTIQFALAMGTTRADTLVIDVSPLVITNASASDIQIVTAGNIVTGAVTIDSTTQHVNIPVNAGGSSGSIRVDGIRVALAGTNSSSVTAKLSWAGDANYLYTASVTVVDSVQSGLVVDPMTDGFQIFNNTVLDSSASITLHEGFAGAFVSSTAFGENTPTQIRIRVSDLPSGLQMTFPTSVTAKETAASLTTVGGGPVTVADATTTVTYDFSGASDSATTIESFKIPFTVSVQGQVALLQPTIDVAIAPIGAAVPSTALPSTSIPRYTDDEVNALAGTSRLVTQSLYWTGIDAKQINRLSIVNPGSSASNLTLTAVDLNGTAVSGSGITNPTTWTLGANQSLDSSLTELFGSATNVATVRLDSTGPKVLALATVASNQEFTSMPLSHGDAESFGVPILEANGVIHVFNPGSSAVSGTLTILSAQGATLATKSLTLNSMAETRLALQDLIGAQSSGQIMGNFAAPVVAVEAFGSGGTFNLVTAQIPAQLPSLFVPVFDSGGAYETDVNLINRSADRVTLGIQPYDGASTPVGAPVLSPLGSSEQLAQPGTQLFHFQRPVTGYLQIQTPLTSHAFFSSYPAISGYARVHTGPTASAVIPISQNPLVNSYILSSGVPQGQYQGIALVNPSSTSVTVSLQVLGSAGNVVDTANLTLAPGQILAKLTTEIFGKAVPEKSVIRVTASAPIVAASAIGTVNNDQIRLIPAQ